MPDLQPPILVVVDPHWMQESPESRVDNYYQSIRAKIAELEFLAKTNNSDIIYGGDLFHKKNPHKISHELVSDYQQLWNWDYGKHWVIIGNHDLYSDNLSDLKKQPINNLILSGAHLVPEQAWAKIGSFYFCAVYGLSDRNIIDQIPNSGPSPAYVIAHAMIVPDNYTGPLLKKGAIKHSQIVEGLVKAGKQQPEYIIVGHIHDSYPTVKVGNITFITPGSLSRGAMTESNINRSVQYIEIPSTGVPILKTIIDQLPSDKIFNLEQNRRKKSTQSVIDVDGYTALIMEETDKVAVVDLNSVVDEVAAQHAIPDDVIAYVKNTLETSK